MNTIVEKITELIKEMLQGWVMSNLEGMFRFGISALKDWKDCRLKGTRWIGTIITWSMRQS